MTDEIEQPGGPAVRAANHNPLDCSARVAELEAENEALRRTLAQAQAQRHSEDGLRGQELRLRLLADTAAGLLAAADPNSVLAPVFRSLSADLGIDLSLGYVADEAARTLSLASCHGVPDKDRAGFALWAVGQPVCGVAAKERRPVHVTCISPAAPPPGCAGIAAMGVRAYVAFPLLAGDGRLLGTLSFGTRTRDRFSDEDLAFLGAMAHHVAVVRERVRAEAGLREGEERFRALVTATSYAVYRMDPDWTEMRRLDGRASPAGRDGPSMEWLVDYIHPDDRAGVCAAVREAVRTGAAFEFEHRVRRADGGPGWTLSRAVPLRGADGSVREWFGAASDITARKAAEEALRESERRLQATQDHAGVGINEIDPEGRYTRVNETFALLTGRTAADFAGRAYWEFIEDEADRREAIRDFGRMVRGEVDLLASQREYTDGRGRRRWAEIAANAVRGVPDAAHPRGRFLYAVRVVQDVTERKLAEGRRSLLVRELNHRVKNTLAVVQSLALQTARGSADPAAFAAAFQTRLAALARAHDLLTRGDWEGAALDAVVRAALEPLLAGDAARLDLSGCPSGGTVLLPGPALALSMALHELATNAIKHGALSAPGGRVSVACRPALKAGLRVVEWVERGGPPVPAAPARRGFGLRLLERGLASQGGLLADLRFEAEGVRCVLRLPDLFGPAAAEASVASTPPG